MAVKQNRKRYILSKIHSLKETKIELIETAIIESAKTLFGEAGKPEIKILSEFTGKNTFVIMTNHKGVLKTKMSMAMVKKINTQDIILQSLKVFGTLKKIKQMPNKEE